MNMMKKEDYDNAQDLHIMCEALKKADRLNAEKIKALAYAVFGTMPGRVMVGYNLLRDVWTIRLNFGDGKLIDLEV